MHAHAAIEPFLDDFEELLRILELSSGFVLIPIVVPGPDVAEHLAHWLSHQKHPTLVLDPDGDEAWKNLAVSLLQAKLDKDGVALVIGRGNLAEDLSLALRLVNERRDAIAKQLNGPLLWCGSADFLVQTGQQAPDFWSVRAVERRIEARKKTQSKKMAERHSEAKDDLLGEALRQEDRKSSEILFLSRMRSAMAEANEDEFHSIIAKIPAAYEEADGTFALEAGMMKAEMARRHGNISGALAILDGLDKKNETPEAKCRIELLRGRVWEKAGDRKRAEEAYGSSHPTATLKNPSWRILAHLYESIFIARTSPRYWIAPLLSWREEAKIVTQDRPLYALATAFLAEVAALEHDARGAAYYLKDAKTLHRESENDTTILFPGEVAEAIQCAHAAILLADEAKLRPPRAPIWAQRLLRGKYAGYILPMVIILPLLFALVYAYFRVSDRIYCFSGPDNHIACAWSLEQCEKMRGTGDAKSAAPCQKTRILPRGE